MLKFDLPGNLRQNTRILSSMRWDEVVNLVASRYKEKEVKTNSDLFVLTFIFSMGFSAVPLDLVKIRKNQRRLKGLLSNPENPNDHLNLQHYPVSIGQLNSYARGSTNKIK